MSITLGLYDIFTAIVPGLLYLYLFVEFSNILGWKSIDLANINTFGQLIAIVVVSLVLGNIVSSFTYKYWYKVFYKQSAAALALKRIRELHPNIKFNYDYYDGDILFSVIMHHDQQLAEKIERTKVNGIMMQKISFGTFLFALLQIYLFVSHHLWLYLGFGLAAIVFSWVSLNRAITMERWFYQDIFREALNYGGNIREILSVSKKITSKKIMKDTSL